VDRDTSEPLHPTAQKLVDTVKEMLKVTSYDNIKSENVLLRSGISRGPLYHHFANFEELIETAQIQIYQEYVRGVIKALLHAIRAFDDPFATRGEFEKIIKQSQNGNSYSLRRQRLGLVHNAASIESFRKKIGVTQEALNQEWMRIYQMCVDKGWGDPKIDPRTFAILIQSTFLGRILDDISPVQMDPTAWANTLIRLLERFCFCTDLASRIQN